MNGKEGKQWVIIFLVMKIFSGKNEWWYFDKKIKKKKNCSPMWPHMEGTWWWVWIWVVLLQYFFVPCNSRITRQSSPLLITVVIFRDNNLVCAKFSGQNASQFFIKSYPIPLTVNFEYRISSGIHVYVEMSSWINFRAFFKDLKAILKN